MEADLLIAAAAALSFAALTILWALAPTQPATSAAPKEAPALPEFAA
jgi:hypothetical protein